MRSDGWRRFAAALLAVTLLAFGGPIAARQSAVIPEIAAADLPPEARQTVRFIKGGGPFPYERDGLVFGNFERQLPVKEQGYYREYTVRTPEVKSRGARRIVVGKGGEMYYTDNHYKSFSRIREDRRPVLEERAR